MDLRVELKNFEPPVDIILNPAFTPVTTDFNAGHFDARRSIYAYCFLPISLNSVILLYILRRKIELKEY